MTETEKPLLSGRTLGGVITRAVVAGLLVAFMPIPLAVVSPTLGTVKPRRPEYNGAVTPWREWCAIQPVPLD